MEKEPSEYSPPANHNLVAEELDKGNKQHQQR